MTDQQNKVVQIRYPNTPSFFDDNDNDNDNTNANANVGNTKYHNKFEFIEVNNNNHDKLPHKLKKTPLHHHHFLVKNLAKEQDHAIQGLFCLYDGYIAYCKKIDSTLEILSYLCIELAILSPKITDSDNEFYFTITKNQITYQFMTNNESIIDDWLSSMKLICVHYSFHEEYKAIKLIGKGSFARVYLAENKITKLQYAVKACSKEYIIYSTKTFAKACIKNEISILKQLHHENIMELHQVYETNNSLYMITELINGKTLEGILSNATKFDEMRYKKILKQILEALAYLSSKGIMHRDLKPDNILIDENDNVKIIDFGLSALITTLDHLIFDKCGTPGYIAPEVFKYDIKNKKTYYDEKCDAFSAGCIFYYMLFGHKFIPGKKASEILKANKEYKNTGVNYQNIFNEYNNHANHQKTKFSRDALHLLLKMVETDPLKRISASMALEHPYIGSKLASMPAKKSFSENDIQTVHSVSMKSPKNRVENIEMPFGHGQLNIETKICAKDTLDTFKLTYDYNHSNESQEKNKNILISKHRSKPSLYLNIESPLLNGAINTMNSEQLSGSNGSTRDTPLNAQLSPFKFTIQNALHNNQACNLNEVNENSTKIKKIKKIYNNNNIGGSKAVLLKNIQKNFDLIKNEYNNNNNNNNTDLIPNIGFSEYFEHVNKFTIAEEDSDTVNTPSPVCGSCTKRLNPIKSKYCNYKN